MKLFLYQYLYNDIVLYVGSTMDMRKRHNEHKSDLNRKDYKFYRYLKEHDIDFEQLDLKYVCGDVENDEERWVLEQELIKLLNPICNDLRAYTTYKQRLQQKREDYYKNREKRLKQKKEYYAKTNRDERLQYHKEYYEKNKKKLSQQKKENYNKDREKILEKTNCDICGITSTKHNLKRHQKRNVCNYYIYLLFV